MRLLVVGQLNGQLASAVKMAMAQGAKVSHVETIAAATHALRAGQGADLLLVDYSLDIGALLAAHEALALAGPAPGSAPAAELRASLQAVRMQVLDEERLPL